MSEPKEYDVYIWSVSEQTRGVAKWTSPDGKPPKPGQRIELDESGALFEVESVDTATSGTRTGQVIRAKAVQD